MRPPLRSSRLRGLIAALAASAGTLGACTALAQTDPPGADLDSLLSHARRHSPELAAMQREAQAAAERIAPAAALPDPVLRVELENINNYGNGNSINLLPWQVGETRYTLMQQLPWPGKRELRRSAAEADADQARARAAASWTEQAARLRTAFSQLYLSVRSERLARENLDLMARLEQVAQVRYAGGLAPQQDAIRAQLEQTAMRAELLMTESEQRQLRARINGLLAREPAAALALPLALPPPPQPSALAWATLMERARQANPLLQAEAARLRSAQAGRELALRNRRPDFNVGVTQSQMGWRLGSVGVMVELNLPLQQDTRRAQERESQAMVEAAQARSESVLNQLGADLAEQLAALDVAQRTEALVRTRQLPQSELMLQSALAAYENGRVDFATLLEAQRQIRKARLDQLKAQVEAQLRLAEIERTVGEPL